MLENSIFLTLEDCVGENPPHEKYQGTFKLKKYLTNRERGEASRYLEQLCRGIDRDTNIIIFMQAVAHLKIHMIESPKWWTESDGGLNLIDTEPVFKLYAELLKAQNPKKEEKKTETTPESPTPN